VWYVLGIRWGYVLNLVTHVTSRHSAPLHDLPHDLASHIDRNSEADALIAAAAIGQDGGVDSDQLAQRVDQRSAGVARIDGRIGLDEVFIVLDAEISAAHGADNPQGHRLADSERVADRERKIAHLCLSRVAQRDCRQVLSVNSQDCDISLWVGADQSSPVFAFIREPSLDLRGSIDNVIVGEKVAIRADDDTGAKALLAPFARNLELTAKP